MGSFIEEYWQSLWTGFTPIVTVVFFLAGLKLGSFMAGYMNAGPIVIMTKFLVPAVLGLSVPFWAMYQRK